MNNRPKPKPGSVYTIIAVKVTEFQYLIGKEVEVIAWDDKGYPAPWGWLIFRTKFGDFECEAAIRKYESLCHCSALPFPHKKGARCAKTQGN